MPQADIFLTEFQEKLLEYLRAMEIGQCFRQYLFVIFYSMSLFRFFHRCAHFPVNSFVCPFLGNFFRQLLYVTPSLTVRYQRADFAVPLVGNHGYVSCVFRANQLIDRQCWNRIAVAPENLRVDHEVEFELGH